MNLVHSLRLRLVCLFVLVALLPVGVAAVLVHRATEEAFHTYNQERALADAETIAAQFDELTGQGAVVVDANQAIIANSVPISIDADPGSAAKVSVTNDSPTTATFGVQSISPDEVGVSIGGVAWGGSVDGVTITMPGLPDQQFLTAMNRALAAGVGLAALGALLLAIVLARHILKPVETLTDAARGMAAGDLDRRVTVHSNDEIGELATAFNSMADNRSLLEGLRRNLVNDVAHELRTPLSNLQGYLELLRDGSVQATPEVLTVLHEESLLLNRLVADLQELALVEAGQLPLSPEVTTLDEQVKSAIEAFRPLAEAKAISLSTRLPEVMPRIVVDVARLNQILRNLLKNAIVHTKSGGSVVVGAVTSPTEIAVTVRDTGSGIAPEHLPFIFDRFYRADPTRARSTGGSGLGLAIVKHLVEAHGGRIDATSEVAFGTTFTFTLPLAVQSDPAVPARALRDHLHRF